MYYADSHLHSIVSHDSDSPRADMAAAAVERGISEICFTDHYDILDMDGSYNPRFDWLPAREEQRKAQAAWGGRLKLRYGLELGNVPADFAAAERALAEPGLDCVLCSVHNLSAGAGATDFYDIRYDTPQLCYAHLDDYFRNMLLSVQWGEFDVLAHVPYPLRYMRERDGQAVTLERYQERIREILRLVIQQGKGIEVNTKNWSPRVEQDYIDLVKTYRELGGEIVTVGSDAHSPGVVGAHIPQVYRLLRTLGLRYVAAYADRKPHFIPLEG